MRLFRGSVAGLVCALLAAASLAPAERVVFRVTEETVFGESVFLIGNRPELGNGQLTQSLRMVPTNYPEWSVAVELPPGITVNLESVIRLNGSNDIANTANGSGRRTLPPVTTAFQTQPDQVIRYDAPAGTSTVTIEVSDSASFTPAGTTTVTMQPVAGRPGRFEARIAAENANRNRVFRLRPVVSGSTQTVPLGDPWRAGLAPIWIRNSEVFLYDPPATVSAPVYETFFFAPTGFTARTIRVVLPRGYTEGAAVGRRYPVIYFEDGQNVFSRWPGPFGTWSADTAVTTAITRGEMREAILIGIDNAGSLRGYEYIPNGTTVPSVLQVPGQGTTGRGTDYLRMVRDQLVPAVEARYRAIPQAEERAHVGSSLGGLIGFHAATTGEFRAVWGSVAALSPSFQLPSAAANAAIARRSPDETARFYMDSGTVGDGYDNVILVRDAMLESGFTLGPRFQHAVGLNQAHNESAWSSRTPAMVRWLFPPEAAGGTAWLVSNTLTGD